MRKNLLFIVLGLAIPGLAAAHPGITTAEWPGHVLLRPFAAPDHILASLAVALGLVAAGYKSARRIIRIAGAALALAGFAMFMI